ncbi:MAG: PQQ-binding-like beta-propeller repeat protein, partial [Aliifodinibius sp.]|nr:PQQ-binding-like beta-propeller repeat protein [Fodinibius sp.]NIV15040.1 PQQ-binding-like beta-propeller repeat protein [Fodinibius sp.]NIY26367.1 PQQ-binding-like beta-propeller repeat protein [Fodinibius sp.]
MNKNRNYIITIILLILAIIPFGIANSQVGEDNEIYIPFVQMNERVTTGDGEWSMVAGNIERTSYTEEEVTGNLDVEWYRPIEAYIPQNSQIIASNGMLYVSTAKGLYALNAANGQLVWRFDTDLPLGNSPSVADGVVYVGGYDRKIHALDAYQGVHLWAFEGARAGFDTNPLVVNDVVFAGNR